MAKLCKIADAWKSSEMNSVTLRNNKKKWSEDAEGFLNVVLARQPLSCSLTDSGCVCTSVTQEMGAVM